MLNSLIFLSSIVFLMNSAPTAPTFQLSCTYSEDAQSDQDRFCAHLNRYNYDPTTTISQLLTKSIIATDSPEGNHSLCPVYFVVVKGIIGFDKIYYCIKIGIRRDERDKIRENAI